MKKGMLVVIDGTDGSGKTTQVKFLTESLKKQNIPFETISFPRYGENEYGRLIKRYLEGEFGSINEIDPYKMACIFAGDRLLAKPLIEKWLGEGKMVIANRYVSASKAHMSANLPEGKRAEFIKWLDELEYKTNGMPKEDITILLLIDPAVGQKNVSGHGTDIHEENLKHLEEASKIYLKLAKEEPNWYVVDCMEGSQMKTREEIHQAVIGFLQSKLK